MAQWNNLFLVQITKGVFSSLFHSKCRIHPGMWPTRYTNIQSCRAASINIVWCDFGTIHLNNNRVLPGLLADILVVDVVARRVQSSDGGIKDPKTWPCIASRTFIILGRFLWYQAAFIQLDNISAPLRDSIRKVPINIHQGQIAI